ncbi:MAG: hypothetical protein ACI31E_03320 [Muribaculaceae bacterium]
MYAPEINKIYRDGNTLVIDVPLADFENIDELRAFEDIPLLLDEVTTPFICETLEDGLQPYPIDFLVFTSEEREIKHYVLDIEINEVEDKYDSNRFDTYAVYSVKSGHTEQEDFINAATWAVKDALIEKGFNPMTFKDTSSPFSTPEEYVMPRLMDFLYFDEIRCRYKFTIDMNNNLVSLIVTVMEPIPEEILSTAAIFINNVNRTSKTAWLSLSSDFRLCGHTCHRTLPTDLSAGRVKSLLADACELVVSNYKTLLSE